MARDRQCFIQLPDDCPFSLFSRFPAHLHFYFSLAEQF